MNNFKIPFHLQNLEYLSWLGLYKDLSIAPTLQPFWNKKEPIPKTPEMTEQVFRKFDNLMWVVVLFPMTIWQLFSS